MLRCLQKDLLRKYNNDGLVSHTSEEQRKVENTIEECYDVIEESIKSSGDDNQVPQLLREKHLKYLVRGLTHPLHQSFQCLDASRPWLTYWITHSLAILEADSELTINAHDVIKFLSKCTNKEGGYGGGPHQISHLATTYAAVNALVTLSTEEALKSIDRNQIKKFLLQMKQNDGSFKMHFGGEIDIRGAYCAISVAKLIGIDDDNLFENTPEWLLSCQTYEGGFGAAPEHEAHGGYTFCAVAALVLLNCLDKCNVKSLLKWVINKQHRYEGGFAGRTNKLVDGCYSFWEAAILPIVHIYLAQKYPSLMPVDKWLFNQQALQEYILCCCQEKNGGLIDKPGKHRDYYHTCYVLAGLSIAQNALSSQLIVGSQDNKVVPIHPLFNVKLDSVRFANEYFATNS
ncbi:protein farnesyltransferase subunit beta-like [Oppia nitens]|uniref:protein farnesyltransferase subunit beta-like n=1 Tax=Oppia nitens TaxID=1686743 RepID=UPI0023DC0206|nr:protein farnesyltransferase subunit beta-like [Oppia nitens]XP_054154070.1 protein farnesyltransferase subunit beta-like [Oppia nitens]